MTDSPTSNMMSIAVALSFADAPRPHATLQAPADTESELREALSVLARAYRSARETTCSAADYEEVLADHRRLVRELDVALNGDGAAQQASLCDIVGQVKDRRWKLVRAVEPTSKTVTIDHQRLVAFMRKVIDRGVNCSGLPESFKANTALSCSEMLITEFSSPGETSADQKTVEFLWRWIDRRSRGEISEREFLNVVTHRPGTPEFVLRRGQSSEEPTPVQLPCTLTKGCWLELGHDGHCD